MQLTITVEFKILIDFYHLFLILKIGSMAIFECISIIIPACFL